MFCSVLPHNMDNTASPDSPLEAAAGAAGPHLVDAFKLLNDETRLAILLTLWEEYEPYGSTEAMAFSELYDRVAIRDSANFTYHLDKLTDHFIEKTNDGYRLRNIGLILVRAVIAGTGLEESTFSATELDISCHRCGAARMQISYQNGAVYLLCPECEGFTTSENLPQGTIAVFEFDPAGVARRSPPELLAASAIRGRNNHRMMMQGVCPTCSGPIDSSLRLCQEHIPKTGEVCPNCGTRDSARVRYVCAVCKHKNSRPIELTVVEHPAVISFYDEHGIDIRWDINDTEAVARGLELLWAMEHDIVSTDPVRVHVTVPCGGEELRLILDENWDVIDIRGITEKAN